MSNGALIVGGSLAGLQAALDLADSGLSVHLVEPSPFLAPDQGTTIPAHHLHARLLEIAKHPNVTTWTNARIERFEGRAGRFQVELSQQPRYVDLSKCTACGDCLEACPVAIPGTEHKAIYLAEGGQPGCAAIDKVGQPPCSHACPGGIHVQGYVALIAAGRFQEALDLIREAIPLPGICGRICTHPCEIDCRRSEVDSPVAIRLLKRFVSDWELGRWQSGESGKGETGSLEDESPNPQPADLPTCQPANPQPAKHVAIVGAGPGGITVADRLARLGYRVTVFEKLPVVGGMMAVGIPAYRLPRAVITREYQRIQEAGVEIRLNTTIGPDGEHSLDDLFALGYDAICLTIGAHKSRELRIPGEDLPGVLHGIDLLRTLNLAQQLDDPQYTDRLRNMLPRGTQTRAVVLGGGNTAMDVSRSLRRLGLQDVRILYRRTRAEMPALPEEIEDAEREGVKLEFLVSPVRVLGDRERGVVGLECQRMELGEPDASGRRRPLPIAGSEFSVDLDLVVLAIGQAPDLSFLGPDHGLTVTRAGRLAVDEATLMTSRPGVFAAGDAISADKMAVIEAIGMGKKAAAAIDAYLRGEALPGTAEDGYQVPVAQREMSPAELAPKPPIAVPLIPPQERVSSFAEVECGYSAEQAVAEAQRCLVCGPCSECLACVRVCEPAAIWHEQRPTRTALDIGAVIYAPDATQQLHLSLAEGPGLYPVRPDEPLAGSAAAARAMIDLMAERQTAAVGGAPSGDIGTRRIGVFVCQCGQQIAGIVDTEHLCQQALLWPAVVHAQTVPFSCLPAGAEAIERAVAAHGLDQVVLAACSCCNFDQVCYSCTYQRLRCKTNLGLLATQPEKAPYFEMVNIREQCAWPHADDAQAATSKALLLISAAVARARAAIPRTLSQRRSERTALVVGSGAAAAACSQALARQGIAVQEAPGWPDLVQHREGHYVVAQNGRSWQATVIVLAPSPEEVAPLRAAFHLAGEGPEPQRIWGGVETARPGVFYCDPALGPAQAGEAAAARAAAWLGRAPRRREPTLALVDAARCRACTTCVEVCEYGAPRLVGEEPARRSWIDPALCQGCGTCAAHCPSGAITAGYSTDAQLEAMLEELLG